MLFLLRRLDLLISSLGAVLVLPAGGLAQFAPSEANLTTISSPIDPGVTISYKVPEGVCETAFDSQQQYTGWVGVPGDFPTNIFFWFVAAREPTPLLSIWLNGGPGSSSMFGFFTESGPCEVVEAGADRLETAAREWGWDRASNMLFIDQVRQHLILAREFHGPFAEQQLLAQPSRVLLRYPHTRIHGSCCRPYSYASESYPPRSHGDDLLERHVQLARP